MKNNGYKCDVNLNYEHRKIMKPILLDALEELFPNEKWVVHHRDGDRTNNDIFNLEITTQSKHFKTHRKQFDLSGSNNGMYGKRAVNAGKWPGVQFDKRVNSENKPWSASIKYNGKRKRLPMCPDPISARIIYEFVKEEI